MKFSRLKKAAVPIKANVLFYDEMGRHINTISQLPIPYTDEETTNFWSSSISNTMAVGSKLLTELDYQNLIPSGFPTRATSLPSYSQDGDIGIIQFDNGCYIEFVITGGW